ncbi:MAG: hypothetical protein PUI85_02150 [Eubacteriales bacterium]|nr:hypothetical protein [Eubacteriales bacterium]
MTGRRRLTVRRYKCTTALRQWCLEATAGVPTNVGFTQKSAVNTS